MKVYTKTGDKGTTALIGGKRVKKSSQRIEAYGTVDELIAWIGLIRDCNIDNENLVKELVDIQDNLMDVAAILAYDGENKKVKVPAIQEEDITGLEKSIDRMDEELPPVDAFVLPGGHKTVSYCHIARTVCRRAERRAIEIQEDVFNGENAFRFLNRMSDYLFVLSRFLSKKLSVKEIKWVPKV
jgi:cob(I)alamin adenosyltransferase